MTAAEVLGKPAETLTRDERNRAKAVNFGIIYGISSFGLSEQLGISREEAQAYIDTYLARFPRVNEFIARDDRVARRSSGYVTTLFGRRRPIPELRASNYQTRSLGERLAVNTVMQGSAADIIKVAMIACHQRLRDDGRRSRLVLQIHDELLFEAADGEMTALRALATEAMVSALPARPAARDRHRDGRDLAGGEMTWTQMDGRAERAPRAPRRRARHVPVDHGRRAP